ncbi:MAG: hypothetical protein E7310_07270 [Clostridiales bacterium]|nr:hypothetical protein [Clostridiales bacterium]
MLKFFKRQGNNKFNEWLNDILKNDLPKGIKAINFNLYEDSNNKWSIELIGSSVFDENNDDWACNEVFTTRDNPFILVKESDWKAIEIIFKNLVEEYLKYGKYANKLKKYTAIGIGFVDGDLSILYKN